MADIVVGSGGGRWREKTSLRFALLAVVVLVVAVGAGVGLQAWRSSSDSDSSATDSKGTSAEVAISKAIDDTYSGKYDDALAAIDNALQKPGLSTTDKYDLYIQQGSTYVNKKDYAKAVDAYKHAMAAQETYVAAAGVGDAAAKKGDKDTAVTYYQKAITLLPQNSSLSAVFKTNLETKISDVEKQ